MHRGRSVETMMEMPNGTVDLEVANGVATITLNRPESLNSMNNHLMDDIRTAIETAEADESVGVVVLTGNGRGFCSGADLNTVGGPDAERPVEGVPGAEDD